MTHAVRGCGGGVPGGGVGGHQALSVAPGQLMSYLADGLLTTECATRLDSNSCVALSLLYMLAGACAAAENGPQGVLAVQDYL